MSTISAADLLFCGLSAFSPGIEFSRPHALWGLALLLPLAWVAVCSRAALPRGRRWGALALRALIVVLLVLALAGLRWMTPSDRVAVMFVVDRSQSVSPERQQAAYDFMRQALASRRPGDTAGVVLFGRDAAIDVGPGEHASLPSASSVITADGTDISRGLALAEAAFPQDQARRIVLISDGNETRGDALAEASAAGERGVQIWTVPYPEPATREVLVDRVEAPPSPRRDEPFDLRVTVRSSFATPAQLVVKRNGVDIGKVPVVLHAGDNVLFIPQRLSEPGVWQWQVSVEAAGDTVAGNNASSAVTSVLGTPRVLYVVGNEQQPGFVPRLLEAQGLKVDVATPRHLPSTLVEMGQYATIVLANVSALELSDARMKLIAAFVRDLGGGLVMLGGPDSFGAGGWYRTPVEDVLPVRMDVRKNKNLPVTGLVLVIDKSGSMSEMAGGLEKMALARESAIATLEMLGPRDQIGVVAFDEAAKWIVPMRTAADREAVVSQVATVRAGGGTALYPAMVEALSALRDRKIPVKHVIVLSDGATAPGDFEDVVKQMRAARMTVSTVAIGQDADRPFMLKLAKMGGGAAYYTDNASLLPRILTRDAVVASHSGVMEEPFLPRRGDAHPITRGLGGTVPALLGYDMTTAREHASVPLLTPQGDPLLAAWRSGLGKTVAFTSDDGRRWSGRWADWASAAPLFAQAVRWTMSDVESGAFRVRTRARGGAVEVDVEAAVADDGAAGTLRATVLDPDGTAHPVALEQAAPGRFKARFAAAGPGGYMVTVQDVERGQARRSGVVLSYSPELKALADDRYLLGRVAALSGGRADARPADVFAPPTRPVPVPHDAWQLLVLAACLLWPLDVAVRRLFLPAGWWGALRGRLGRAGEPAPAADATLQALKSVRRRSAEEAPRPPAPRPAAPFSEAADVPAAPPPSKAAEVPATKPIAMPEGSDTLSELRKARRERRGERP